MQEPGARVSKSGEVLVIETDESKTEVAIGDVSELVLHGPVSLTTPALGALLREEIPVTYASSGGWVLGHTVSTGHRNIAIRMAQYRAAFDERQLLSHLRAAWWLRRFATSRVFLRRNFKAGTMKSGAGEAERDRGALAACGSRRACARPRRNCSASKGRRRRAISACSRPCLARRRASFPEFSFEKRTRRPPADPVNAMLSFAYSLLTRTWLTMLSAVGFDPYLGFYHQPRFGRPALALDMMEPFRPILARLHGHSGHQQRRGEGGRLRPRGPAVNLKPHARRAFIAAYERRLEQEVTHPVFGYRVSMRWLLEVQARLLARHLGGEIEDYPHYLVR